jgi:hypothetical protein
MQGVNDFDFLDRAGTCSAGGDTRTWVCNRAIKTQWVPSGWLPCCTVLTDDPASQHPERCRRCDHRFALCDCDRPTMEGIDRDPRVCLGNGCPRLTGG